MRSPAWQHAPVPSALDTDVPLGRSTTVLMGADNGKYPSGNSVLVAGTQGALLIDPSVSVRDRGGPPVPVDRILVSHSHEDHMVGLGSFPSARVHAHADDLLGLHSLDGFMQVYGMPPAVEEHWRHEVLSAFSWSARPDATGFTDGEVFDLGGVRVTAVHLAGHTRGHSGFLVEPDGVLFVGDVDLTGFGPYYGDHWSDLEDFERSIAKVRDIEADAYVTFHHKGIVHGHDAFEEQLDRFAAVIGDREQRMLAFLAEPRTLEEMVAHRFVYRAHVALAFADHVERRTAELHLARLVRDGGVTEVEPGRYRAT